MKSTEKSLEYRVEKLSEGNLPDVGTLHTAVYGVALPHNFFLKKYDTAFTGIRYTGYLAYNRQKMPIAFYAVIPCFLRFKDKVILSAQSADTMTHPEYRNKGLFVELALLTFQLCRDAGIRLVFGFPNQNSLPGFINKLGWQTTGRMDCFIINSQTFPWRRWRNKLPHFKNSFRAYQQNVLKKWLADQQGLPNSVFNDGFAGVYRNHQYRQYKTYTDTYVIHAGHSTLWIKINGALLIGDIAVMPEEFAGMMDQLKKLAAKLGIKEIHFHSSPGTTLHGLFAIYYKSIPSFPVIYKDLGENAPLDQLKFTSADIDTF